MKRTASQSMSFTSSNLNKESTYNFNAPDYLVDLTSLVQSHPDADLMVVRANYPRNEFDPNGDYTADQAWRLLTYNWTDSERRRQPLDGCRRRRRRRPHRALEELEDRRRSRPELRRVRDGQGRVHPLHVPPGRLEHASVVRPRPGGAHGGRHLPRPAAQRKDEGDSGHALQDPDRLLRQRRLAVGDHDPGRGRCVHGDDERPGRRSVRHVRRRGRPERRRREHGRARLGDRRRDRHAGCGRQAHRPAPLRWRGHGGEPVRPALQQRLLLRSQRLDVARGVRRLALLLRRRPRRAG